MQSPTSTSRPALVSRSPLRCWLKEDETPSHTYTLSLMVVELFGSNISWFLFGFIVAQAYTYYTRPLHDPPLLKALVYGCLFIELFQSGLEGYFTYGYLGGAWGNPFVNVNGKLVFQLLQDLQPALDSLTGVLVQLFFTWRIWIFCRAICGSKARLFVAAICILIVLGSMCSFIAIAILPFLLIPSFVDLAKFGLGKMILVWTIPSAVIDVTITVSMMIILTNARSRSNVGETRDKVSQLIRITLQTGFLTTILAIPIAPLYILSLDTAAYTFTTFPLGKCYLISLLANLNARSRQPTVRAGIASDNLLSTQISFDQNNNDRSAMSAGQHGGIISSVRFAARAIRRHITAPRAPTSHASRTRQQEIQLRVITRDGGTSGSSGTDDVHTCDGKRKESDTSYSCV